MITIPSREYFDTSEPPDDLRSREQIEIDAASRAKEKREAHQLIASAENSKRNDAAWEAVNAKRLAAQNN